MTNTQFATLKSLKSASDNAWKIAAKVDSLEAWKAWEAAADAERAFREVIGEDYASLGRRPRF